MATLQQLETALVNADQAGDADAARQLAAAILNARSEQAATGGAGTPIAQEQSARHDRMVAHPAMRVALGAADPFMGAVQLLDETVDITPNRDPGLVIQPKGEKNPWDTSISDQIRGINQSIVRGRIARGEADMSLGDLITGEKPEGLLGADWWRVGGNVASPANFALALRAPSTLLGAAGTGSLYGLLGGLTMPTTGENYWEQKAAQAVGGTLAGAATGPVIAVVGKVAQALVPKVQAWWANLSPARTAQRAAVAAQDTERLVAEALNDVGATADDLPPGLLQQIHRQVNEALASGKQLDAAALLRQADFERLGMPYTLGQVTRDPTQFALERNLRANDPRLTVRFNEQSRLLGERLKGYGGSTADEQQVAGGRLKAWLTQTDEAAGKEVTAAYNAARASSGRDLRVVTDDLAGDLLKIQRDYRSSIPDAVEMRLHEYGLLGGKKVTELTVNEANDLLQQLNKLRGNDNARNSALDKIGAAVKKALYATDDAGGVFMAPMKLARERFKARDLVPALGAAANGDASADKFVAQYLVNGETSEVAALAKLLREKNPELFEQARKQLGAVLLRKSYGENPAADAAIKPEGLAVAIRQLGSGKLKAFFSADEVDNLLRIGRVSGYVEKLPAAAPVSTANSLAALLPYLSYIPGAETSKNVARLGMALKSAVTNQRDISNALAGRVQATSALTPEQRAIIARILGGLQFGTGAAGAQVTQ